MTNPKQIARLIAEDEDTKYDKCPECGDEYATVVGDEVACTNKACTHYNADYETLAPPINLVAYINDTHDMSWNDWLSVMQDTAETGNVRGLYIGNEPYIIVWDGPHDIPNQRLVTAVVKDMDDADMDDTDWKPL